MRCPAGMGRCCSGTCCLTGCGELHLRGVGRSPCEVWGTPPARCGALPLRGAGHSPCEVWGAPPARCGALPLRGVGTPPARCGALPLRGVGRSPCEVWGTPPARCGALPLRGRGGESPHIAGCRGRSPLRLLPLPSGRGLGGGALLFGLPPYYNTYRKDLQSFFIVLTKFSCLRSWKLIKIQKSLDFFQAL